MDNEDEGARLTRREENRELIAKHRAEVEMGTIPDAERKKVMEAHRFFESIVESAGTTPFEIRKKIMTAHMLAESIVERATVATPRTDAAEVTMLRLDGDADVVVAAFFARQLERENAELQLAAAHSAKNAAETTALQEAQQHDETRAELGLAYQALRLAKFTERERCAKVADEMLAEVAGGERVGKAIRQKEAE